MVFKVMGRDFNFLAMKIFLFILIFWVQFILSARPNHRQEAAKVEYYNPKYFSEAYAFTGRVNRNSPYLTNITATTIVPMGNNVTIRIQHNMKNSAIDFEIVRKACDLLKLKWINDLATKYSNIDPNTCPVAVNTYRVYNLEFEKDKIMMPIPKGINEFRVVYEKTDTREVMLKIYTALYVYQ